MSTELPEPEFERNSSCVSLLSALLAAYAEPMDIYFAEVGVDGSWDYAFWNYDPDGVMCSFRCAPTRSIWVPVETPSYTGNVRPYGTPESHHGEKPWHGETDPK